MTPEHWLTKARRALASARVLLTSDDAEGACNRAYYAMHDAARAALAHGAPDETFPKSHSGLIAAFSQQWVKTGRVPIDLGRAFNRAADLRLLADYAAAVIDSGTALSTVEWAAEFVDAIGDLVCGGRAAAP